MKHARPDYNRIQDLQHVFDMIEKRRQEMKRGVTQAASDKDDILVERFRGGLQTLHEMKEQLCQRFGLDPDENFEPIPHEEPVFLLRGQDAAAWRTVMLWISVADKLGAKPDILASAAQQVAAMLNWNQKQTPDMP